MANWQRACKTGDIDEEDLIRFDHDGRTFAIYRSPPQNPKTPVVRRVCSLHVRNKKVG